MRSGWQVWFSRLWTASHLLINEPHNEGTAHCESSLFNNEGIGAHCSNNEPNNEPPARFWEIISPWEMPNSECTSTVWVNLWSKLTRTVLIFLTIRHLSWRYNLPKSRLIVPYQGTHGARCTIASPTVQLCSRAPSPRCERHLLHRAAPCTTVQADFPASAPSVREGCTESWHRRCSVSIVLHAVPILISSLVLDQPLLGSKRRLSLEEL